MKYLVILLSVHTLHKTANNLQSAVTKEVNLEKKNSTEHFHQLIFIFREVLCTFTDMLQYYT